VFGEYSLLGIQESNRHDCILKDASPKPGRRLLPLRWRGDPQGPLRPADASVGWVQPTNLVLI